MKRPDFLIAGFAKCVSTSLFKSLQKHPNIWMPEVKEPNFFNFSDNSDGAFKRYLALFANAPSDAVIGEASIMYAQYSKHLAVPARIRGRLPGVKLIFIVRNPVDQLVSHVYEWMKYESKPIDPEMAVRMGFFLCSAMFFWQIQGFLRHFDRDNIMIVFFLRTLSAIPPA